MTEPIYLSNSIRQFAEAQVISGRFASIADYLCALVFADEQLQRATERLAENPQLEALLEEGLRGGEGRCWTPELRDELKQQILDRAKRSTSNAKGV